MSYNNNTSVSSYIRPLSVSISYHVASNGYYYYADGYEPTQVFTREAGSLTVVREFEQADICNPTPGISYVGGFYPAWPISNPFAGMAGDIDYSVGRNGVALWSFYTWEQDGEDQVASHCVHVQVVDGVSTVTVGDVELGYACAVELRQVSTTPTVTLAEALEALEVAELEADEAALYADTEEGYQAYCAAVQRMFDAEDAMLAAGESAGELYVPYHGVEEVEAHEYYHDVTLAPSRADRLEEYQEYSAVLAYYDLVEDLKVALIEANEAATRIGTLEGCEKFSVALQRLYAAEAALEAADRV